MDASTLYAGSSATWDETVDSTYSNASGYAVEYELINQDGKITIDATTATITYSGNTATVLVAAATTADWVPGAYRWVAYATKTGERWILDTGSVSILPDYSSASAYDARSHVQRTLDALEALIEGRAVNGVESLSIRGRSLTRMPITELVQWRDKYRGFLAAEQDADRVAAGGNSRRDIRTKFEAPR